MYKENPGYLSYLPPSHDVSPSEWGPTFVGTPRGHILRLIRGGGTSTAADLAAATGTTPNGVRSQLMVLEKDGWIRPAGRRRGEGAGKPSVEYELNPSAEPLLSSAYRPYLVALLSAMQDRLGQPQIEGLLRDTGRRLAAGIRPDGRPVDPAEAISVLEELGGSVVARKQAVGLRLEGSGCPIGDAVAVEPKACESLAALLSGLLGVEVRTACDHGGRPRCRFDVPPHGKTNTPGV